jgi:hypothetical protein
MQKIQTTIKGLRNKERMRFWGKRFRNINAERRISITAGCRNKK